MKPLDVYMALSKTCLKKKDSENYPVFIEMLTEGTRELVCEYSMTPSDYVLLEEAEQLLNQLTELSKNEQRTEYRMKIDKVMHDEKDSASEY